MMPFPVYERDQLLSDRIASISVLGTIHDHRHRWNPFAAENEMTRSKNPTEWVKWLKLSRKGGRNQDGVYSFRFVINHNPRRLLKLGTWVIGQSSRSSNPHNHALRASLQQSTLGREARNLTVHVHKDCEACLIVNEDNKYLQIEFAQQEAITYINHITSMQVNGFIWDALDMFEKFNENGPGREMQQIAPNIWVKKIPLTTKGGIDFRADGVYQFLISTNGDEDQGFGAVNHRQSDAPDVMDLVPGTGFGSSHGTSYHSAPTIRVLDDDIYTITAVLEPGNEQLTIQSTNGSKAEIVNNQASSIQLLGDIYEADSFDPLKSQAQMSPIETTGQLFEKIVKLEKGNYSINFAIGSELFLDTMGIGCWLETNGTSISGVGWHGKPNECNIGFRVIQKGCYRFTYNRTNDIFSIAAYGSTGNNPLCLEAVLAINNLSIVGNLPSPLIPWDPKADKNLMISLGQGKFEKVIDLVKGVDYQFKFVGNQSNWQIVFADYELDGYGMSYTANNPDPYNSRLEDLRVYGHLTTHGNPPAISFIPSISGLHRVIVDLWSGAYGIKAMPT